MFVCSDQLQYVCIYIYVCVYMNDVLRVVLGAVCERVPLSAQRLYYSDVQRAATIR